MTNNYFHELNGNETANYIKQFCTNRVNKMGIHSTKSGACKGCPYRYRGEESDLQCCMFANIPMDWGK